jgi:hypothetical protein
MGELDAEVVPGLVGDGVALVVQGGEVAAGDGAQGVRAGQGLVADLLVGEAAVVALGQVARGAVVGVEVELEPVQAAAEGEVELGALGAPVLVDEQRLLGGGLGDQQGAVVEVFLQVGWAELVALMQVVPVDLAALLGDLGGGGVPALFLGTPDVLHRPA